jgi:hypothetical protein
MSRVTLLLGCLALLLGACGTSNAVLTDSGLLHERFGYRISSAGGPRAFISGDWRVENFLPSGSAKSGSDYDTAWYVDSDDDGEDDEMESASYYDLRLEHRRNNGSIWVRTFPVSDVVYDKALTVLVQNYVENIASAGYFTAGISEAGTLRVEERRFATRVLDTQTIGLDHHDAAAVLFDVANVNQLQMTADARSARALVVISRTPFRYRVRTALGVREWPVLMFVGYANAPADFDASLPDFQRFLGTIELAPVAH